MPTTDIAYKAFLSYSHADSDFARKLHRYLEGFRVPKSLVGASSELGIIPAKLGSFFMDREELASAPDLSEAVNKALAASEFLIVICSPQSARSHWVSEEILTFKRLGKADRILCILIGGEPNSDQAGKDPDQECFAPALRYHLDDSGKLSTTQAEPIAADARTTGDGYKSARLKLVAGLLGVGFDQLRKRELQRQNRRLIGISLASVVGMVFAVSLSYIAIQARNDAERHREEADDLIGFMLGDLHHRLNEVGRLDILDSVADKTMNYFTSLPTDELNAHTRIQRATALIQLGQVQQTRGSIDDANALFADSLQALEKICGDIALSSDTDCLFQLGQANFWVGDGQWALNRIDKASENLSAYLAVSRRLTDLDPTNQAYQQELAFSYNNLAAINENLGDRDKALELIGKAIGIAERLNQESPHDQNLQIMLADFFSWEGRVLYGALKLEKALATYQKYWAAVQTGYADNPENTLWLDHKMRAQRWLAQIMLSLGRVQDAENHYNESAKFAEVLLQIEPENDYWQIESAIQMQALTTIAIGQNRLDEAKEILKTGMASVELQLANNTSSVDWQALSFNNESLAIKLLAESGQADLAWEQLQPLLNVGRSLQLSYPDDKSIMLNLCELFLTAGHVQALLEFEGHTHNFFEEALTLIDAYNSDSAMLIQTLSMQARLNAASGVSKADNIPLLRLRNANYAGPELEAYWHP